MKKVKLNLDKTAVQNFFIHHVEKIVLAGVAVCFLLFVYRAVGRESYQHTADQLISSVRDAKNKIVETPPVPPKEVKDKWRDYAAEVENFISNPIDVEPYRYRHLWKPLVVAPLPKRGEPLLFPVKELRGAAGHGTVPVVSPKRRGTARAAMLNPGASGEGTRGERWVVLTGLVPYVDQFKAYQDAFKNVRGSRTGAPGVPGGLMGEGGRTAAGLSGTDVPQYVYYNVERAEVTSPGQSEDDLAWKTIYVSRARKEAEKMGWRSIGSGSMLNRAGADGIVAPQFRLPGTDFPLPPLVGRQRLGEEFAHPPEIPVLERRMPGMPGVPGDQPDEPGPDLPGEEKPAPDEPGADRPPDMPTGPGGRRVPGMPGMVPGMEGPMPGLVPGMEGPMGPGMEGFGPMRPGQTRQEVSPFRLFRFVDRSVVPGKRYRYRVRLMLINPNYGQEPRLLERVELGADRYITTDWSKPTDVVLVPRDDRLLVRSVKPPARITQAPTASILLTKWVNDKGVEADKKIEKAYRGQMLNLPGCKYPEEERKPRPKKKPQKSHLQPGGPMAPGEEGMFPVQPEEATQPEMPRLGELTGPRREPIDVDYLTESILLDMRGGYRIDLRRYEYGGVNPKPELNAPGEVLLLDPEGNLVVQSDLEDEAELKKIEESDKAPGQDMMGPGMMPGGMPEMVPGMEGMPGEMLMPGMEGASGRKDRRGKDSRGRKRTGPLRP